MVVSYSWQGYSVTDHLLVIVAIVGINPIQICRDIYVLENTTNNVYQKIHSLYLLVC